MLFSDFFTHYSQEPLLHYTHAPPERSYISFIHIKVLEDAVELIMRMGWHIFSLAERLKGRKKQCIGTCNIWHTKPQQLGKRTQDPTCRTLVQKYCQGKNQYIITPNKTSRNMPHLTNMEHSTRFQKTSKQKQTSINQKSSKPSQTNRHPL